MWIPPILLICYVFGFWAAIHALLNKHDPRAALGWTAVCLLVPGGGPIFYILFGVNRIRTRAQIWMDQGRWNLSPALHREQSPLDLRQVKTDFDPRSFYPMVRISETVTQLPLVKGCSLKALHNGEQAFPAMLEAIAQAKKWVLLSTYIFESNRTGHQFVKALGEAKKRGVEVRVLIDGIGARYSQPRPPKLLKEYGIHCVLFLPPKWNNIYLNLRTHRKILLVDGEVGYTGGMNIGDRHLVELAGNKNPTQDLMFEIKGPVLPQLQQAFFADWVFVTGKEPEKEFYFEAKEAGEAFCRGVMSGPNMELEKIRLIMLGAIGLAQRSVRVMTPYFIPDTAMISALITAAMRGVTVEIILPEKNNLNYVQWASQAYFAELLPFNIKIYYQKPPFAHTKYFLMDDFYSLVGSANVDPRSFRLNFEFNLEVFDHGLNQYLSQHFQEVLKQSRPITIEEIEARSFKQRLRDSFFKLFSPYL